MIVDTPKHKFQVVAKGSFGSEVIGGVSVDVSLGLSNYQKIFRKLF